MTNRIRILPVLIVFALGLLGLKAVSIAETAAQNADLNVPDMSETLTTEQAAAEGEAAAAALSVDNGGATNALTCPPTVDFAAEAGVSQYEIQVLRSLTDRRKALDTRESDLDTREQLIAAAEARLDEQITELQTLETGVKGLLGQLEEQEEQRILGLVKVYETMKSKDAARIFETLDNDILLKVASRMKSGPLAEVMANMSSERARQLTRMLAEQSKMPQTAGDLLAKGG